METMRISFRTLAVALTLVTIFCATAGTASAQAKSKGNGHKVPPGQAKKVATPAQAISVTRDVLAAQGFAVVRVEQLGGRQVVYYRRGNMGRGKGQGPLMKMYVRPTADRIVFEQAPPKALIEINLKLGQ
jgi:outer membrane receptor protein involved in Fe transport